jgi:O-antigen/teichoic acid export membrane protein
LRAKLNVRPDTLRIGAWGLGNSLLIPAYGVFAILVVFRVTPEQELGAYLVLQAIYLMAVQLARSFGYTPLIRHFFDHARRGAIVGSSLALTLLFHCLTLGSLVLLRNHAARLLACPPLPGLTWYVVGAVILGIPAELRIAILQAMHHTRQVFLINATYHVAMVVVISVTVMSAGGIHATKLLEAAVVAAGASSVVSLVLAPRGLFNPRVSRGEIRRMYEYGRFTLGTSLSGVVFTRVDVLILSAFRGPVEVAAYGVSKVFARIFDIYLHTAALVLFPLFCRLWSERRREELRRAYRRLLIASNAAFAMVVAGLAVVAIPMVRLFYGDKYPTAGPLLIAFSVTGLTIPWMTLAQNLINAAGVPSFVFGTRLLIAALNLALDIVLIRQFGAMGAILATLISFTLLAVFMNRRVSRVFMLGQAPEAQPSPLDQTCER